MTRNIKKLKNATMNDKYNLLKKKSVNYLSNNIAKK